MEPTPRYPLTSTALGDGFHIEVDKVVQATLFEHAASAGARFAREGNRDRGGDLETSVELSPYPLTGTWQVRWPHAFGAIIGHIDAETRSYYAPVELIHDCGFIPAARATFSLDRATGSYAVTVHLAPTEFVVARNNAPEGALVLPSGSGRPGERIYVEVAGGDFTATETMLMSPGQWLVGLSVLEGKVVVTCDDRVLGTLGAHDNDRIREILKQCEHEPTTPVLARAIIVEGAVTLDVARHATTTAVRNLPALPVAETPKPAPFHLYEYSDGTVAVTVEGYAAIDPEDQPSPKASARTVVVPEAPAETAEPEEAEAEYADSFDDAPTQYFPSPVAFTPTSDGSAKAAADDSYLSEVEKVRLRRAQREKHIGHGPRHVREGAETTFRPVQAGEKYSGRHRKAD